MATEEGLYREAYACYLYSLNYENHPTVAQELAYIESMVRTSLRQTDATAVLQAGHIPVL